MLYHFFYNLIADVILQGQSPTFFVIVVNVDELTLFLVGYKSNHLCFMPATEEFLLTVVG